MFKTVSKLFIISVFLYHAKCVCAHPISNSQYDYERLPKLIESSKDRDYVKVVFQVNNDPKDFFKARYRISSDRSGYIYHCDCSPFWEEQLEKCHYITKKEVEMLLHLRSGKCNPDYTEPRAKTYMEPTTKKESKKGLAKKRVPAKGHHA